MDAAKLVSSIRIFRKGDGRISDVVMRYSPSGDPIGTLRAFVEAVSDAECEILVDSTGEVLPPDFDRVQTALREHSAFRFLSDPHAAIREAADETDQGG
jgi:hypothetical protein